MAGLAGAITPGTTGTIAISVSGDFTNTYGIAVQIRYGTGAAPSNGAAATGTAVGNRIVPVLNLAGATGTFSIPNVIVTGLTPATAYWLDIAQAAPVDGTTVLTKVHLSAFEIK
jgi:hypothetical protein